LTRVTLTENMEYDATYFVANASHWW
jgi:hypothetical protein